MKQQDWKILGSVEGGEILVLSTANEIRVSYPEALDLDYIIYILRDKEYEFDASSETFYYGSSEGEMEVVFQK